MATLTVRSGQQVTVHVEFDYIGPAQDVRLECILVLPGTSLAVGAGGWVKTASGALLTQNVAWTVRLADSFPAARVRTDSPPWTLGPDKQCLGPLNLGFHATLMADNHLAAEAIEQAIVRIVDQYDCVAANPPPGYYGIY